MTQPKLTDDQPVVDIRVYRETAPGAADVARRLRAAADAIEAEDKVDCLGGHDERGGLWNLVWHPRSALDMVNTESSIPEMREAIAHKSLFEQIDFLTTRLVAQKARS